MRFAVKMLNPQYGQTVYDPFCGTGGFLIEAFRHLGQQTRPSKTSATVLQNQSLFGTEITSTARIAKMNMILFGDGHSGVAQNDSLSYPQQSGGYDNVLSNIPFSLDIETSALRVVDPTAKDADEACLLHCFNRLKDGGQMCVVVPEGLVVNRSHRALWQRLCNEARIRAIMMLPRSTFAPYTLAGTRLIHLTDKGQAHRNWYYQVNLTAQPHFYRQQVTDFPISDLTPAEQRKKTYNAHSAIKQLITAQAHSEESMRSAIESVNALYQRDHKSQSNSVTPPVLG